MRASERYAMVLMLAGVSAVWGGMAWFAVDTDCETEGEMNGLDDPQTVMAPAAMMVIAYVSIGLPR